MVDEIKITKEYLRKVNQEIPMIPLTFDPIFKGVFERNLEVLKRFLIITLELELEINNTSIELLNTELLKENFMEYQKNVDILVLLNNNIYIDIEINRSNFEKVKLRNFLYSDKIFSSLLEKGDNIKKLKDIYFYQLNLNTEDKTITYGEEVVVAYGLKTNSVYMDQKYIVIKYLEFYRNLYYTNDETLKEEEIWLAALTSSNFIELNEILSHILSSTDKEKIINEAIRMSKSFINIHEWEKEKCDELVRLESQRIDHEEGFTKGRKEGIEQGIVEGIEQGIIEGKNQNTNEIILTMLEKNLDKNLISEITKKTIKEIEKLEKTIKN